MIHARGTTNPNAVLDVLRTGGLLAGANREDDDGYDSKRDREISPFCCFWMRRVA
jgi:hypothetical protein